jgi:phage shock protein C
MDDRLYRSSDDRMIGGVAGGIAEHWDLDPSAVRIVWALLILFSGGLFLLLYLIMWIVVPEDDGTMRAHDAAWTAGATTTPGTAPAAGADAAATVAATREEARRARHAARQARRAARRERGDPSVAIVGGAILIVLGGLFLLHELVPSIDVGALWPLLLIGLGIAVLVLGFSRDQGAKGPPS